MALLLGKAPFLRREGRRMTLLQVTTIAVKMTGAPDKILLPPVKMVETTGAAATTVAATAAMAVLKLLLAVLQVDRETVRSKRLCSSVVALKTGNRGLNVTPATRV